MALYQLSSNVQLSKLIKFYNISKMHNRNLHGDLAVLLL